MKILLMLVPAAVLLIGSASAAPMGAMGGGVLMAQGTHDPFRALRKKHALEAIRQEALKQQAADGGKLTDAHRAELQHKIDTVQAGNF